MFYGFHTNRTERFLSSLCRDVDLGSCAVAPHLGFRWVAVKELKLSYHDMDVQIV